MTPLAHRIVKELTLPARKRTMIDQCGLLSRMDDVHCFDVTEAFDVIVELARKMGEDPDVAGVEIMGFLPAPKTWVEFRCGYQRRAFLLDESVRADGWADVYEAYSDKSGVLLAGQSSPKMHLALREAFRNLPVCHDSRAQYETHLDNDGRIAAVPVLWFIYAALAVINSPRVIGRRQHMPHAGLERNLIKQQAVVGKFPLHAWTEIVLKVTPPEEHFDEAPREAHYTGERALHFCRAYIQVRNGKLIYVSAHWRGNGALGIKRSRYRLAA